jgi:predicted Zn-dependent peptidase
MPADNEPQMIFSAHPKIYKSENSTLFVKKITLSNGVRIFFKKTSSPTACVMATVTVGSADEKKTESGYSHFIEHLLFEGTKTRTNFQIANEIEKIGGELNGATSGDRTIYYAKVPKKYTQKAADIISDILVNPSFSEKTFRKEKTVILSEIDLFYDDPKLHQWQILERNLFSSALKNPTAGTKESIKKCTREKLFTYYKKHYRAENMIVLVTGKFGRLDFSELLKIKRGGSKQAIKEKPAKRNLKCTEKRKINQSYVLRGFKVPKKCTKESAVFDLIQAVLGRGASGKIFDEIRNKRGLGYSVGVFHESGMHSGLFSVAVSTKKDNINQVEQIITDEIIKLKNLSAKELSEAKKYLLGKLEMDSEDTKALADHISSFIACSSEKMLIKYKKTIKNITNLDVKRALSHLKYGVTAVIAQK